MHSLQALTARSNPRSDRGAAMALTWCGHWSSALKNNFTCHGLVSSVFRAISTWGELSFKHRAGEMAQQVEYWLYKHGDLSLISQPPLKGLAQGESDRGLGLVGQIV